MTPNDHSWVAGWFVTDPLCLIFLLVMLAYFTILEGLLGATFGKWITGLRVIHQDGGIPGLDRALVRNILRIVDGLPALCILGVVLIVTLPERTRFGDLVARTRVIRKSRKELH